MAKLNAPLKDICTTASQRIADLQSMLDAANKTIVDQAAQITTLSESADPNITPDGIDAANSLAALVGVPAPAPAPAPADPAV